MLSVLLLLTSLAIFLVLTERIDVGLIYTNELTIDIQLNVFAIVLTNAEKRSKPQTKRRTHPTAFGPTIKFAHNVLRRSEIILNKITVPSYNSSAAALPLMWSARISLISLLLSIIENEAKKFSAQNITLPISEHNNFEMDIILKISLLKLIAPMIKFIAATIGIKLKKYRGVFLKWQKTR